MSMTENLIERFMFDLAYKNANGDTKQFAAYVFQCCSDVVLDKERKEIIRLALEAVQKRRCRNCKEIFSYCECDQGETEIVQD